MPLVGYPPFVPSLPDPQYLTINEVRASSTTYKTLFVNKGVDFSVKGSYSDAEIDSLISQASRLIDGYIGGTLVATVNIEDTMGSGSDFLQLRKRPLWRGVYMTLTAVSLAGSQTITVDDRLGVLAGQYVLYPTNPDIPVPQTIISPFTLIGPSVANNYVIATGPGDIQLTYPLTRDHAIGEPVIINGLDNVSIRLPYSTVPVALSVLTPRYAQSQLLIWTPLEIQLYGTVNTFPKDIPLVVQYTSGYTPPFFPAPLKQACLQLMLYLSTTYRYEGVKRIKSDERAIEFGEFLPQLPTTICTALNRFSQVDGFK